MTEQTKEQIREKHLLNNGLSVNKSPVGRAIQAAAYAAMLEYAQQQSIAFAEWILSESILPRDTNWFDAGNHYDSHDLYLLFLKHQNKQ